MKKTLPSWLLLLFAAPLFAGSVDITIDGSGNIILSNIVGDPPVGLALKVDAAAGAGSEDINCVSGYGSFFDIFIDYAHDNTLTYDPDTNPGHPVAKDGSPGVPASVVENGSDVSLAEPVIVLCMGELNNAADSPDPVTLARIGLSSAGDVHLDVDDLRGGVVDATGAEMTVNFVGGIGSGMYYVESGCDPHCWNCVAQAFGDCNGDGCINFSDLLCVKEAFFSSIGQLHYNPCADFDRNGSVNFMDLNIIKTNFFQCGLPPCSGEIIIN